MSVSNRSGSLATGLAQQQNRADDGTAEEEAADQNQADATNDEPAIGNVPTSIEAESAQAQTQVAEQREQADLQAQQDMAFWAMLMFFATLATVAITALGVWLVKRTLDETIKAVRETGEATEAMREANEITERIGTAQARAYLSVRDKSFTIDEEGWLDIGFEVINSGQSPARNVNIKTEAFYRKAPSLREIQSMGSTLVGMGDLAAGETRPWIFELDAEGGGHPCLRKDAPGGGMFQIKVVAEYDTVFPHAKGSDGFLFEAFLLDQRTRLKLQAQPKGRILRTGGRKRNRKSPGNNDSSHREA